MRIIPGLLLLILGLVGCGRPEPSPAAKPVDQSRAKSQFDAERFDVAFDAIAAWHDSVATGWAPIDTTARTVSRARFDGLAFDLNDELQMLWERVGTAPSAFVLDFRLLGAGDARARYDALRADPNAQWRPNWVPLLEAGDRWILVESSRGGAPAGPVVALETGAPPVVAFTNLTTFLETFAAALDAATWTDGRMQIDAGVLADAHAAANLDLELPPAVIGR